MRRNEKCKELSKLLNQIRYYNKQNDLDMVFELIEQANYLYPNSDAIKYEMGMVYKKQNKLKEASLLFEDLIINNRRNRIAAMYELIKLCGGEADLSNNVDEYVKILINENYKVVNVYFQYGKYLEKLKKIEEAEIYYQKAADLGNEKAKAKLTNLRLNITDNPKTNIDVDKILVEKTDTISELDLKIKALKQFNKIKEIGKLLMLFERKKNNIMIDTEVGYIIKKYLKIGYIEEAKKTFYKYENRIIDQELKEYILAIIDVSENNYESAIKRFKLLTLSENMEFVYNSYDYLAKIANINKNVGLEKYYYQKLLERIPENDYAIFSLACIDYREGNIEDSKKKLSTISDVFSKVHTIAVSQLKILLGLDINKDDQDLYSLSQYIDYNDIRAIYHIGKHASKYENAEMSIFKDGINIEELYYDVVLRINNMQPATTFMCSDHYVVKHENIGVFNNKNVDYIEIVTIPNTKKIITMYPIASDNMLAKTTIIKPKEQIEENNAVKRKSQIDKFYERYGIIS